jgi:hypothetical protein
MRLPRDVAAGDSVKALSRVGYRVTSRSVFLGFVFAAVLPLHAQEPLAAAPRKFALTLSDGSRLICEPALENLPLETSFADLKIPMERVADVTFSDKDSPAAVNLKNGDKLQGKVKLAAIEAKTLFGPVRVPIEHVRRIADAAEQKAVKKPIADSPSRRNQCINNLRMIDAAKEQWAMATRKSDGDVVNVPEMVQYIKGAALPVCPAGGDYAVNPIGRNPTCSVPGHAAEF